MSNTFNRKEFLKRFGLGVGAIMATAANPAWANINDDTRLDDAKRTFLREYAGWLKEFNVFVKRRNNNLEDIDNNKRLMELSAEADQRKVKLESYMEDPVFAEYFNAITEDITKSI